MDVKKLLQDKNGNKIVAVLALYPFTAVIAFIADTPSIFRAIELQNPATRKQLTDMVSALYYVVTLGTILLVSTGISSLTRKFGDFIRRHGWINRQQCPECGTPFVQDGRLLQHRIKQHAVIPDEALKHESG